MTHRPIHLITERILDLVAAERLEQNKKWKRTPGHWLDPETYKLTVLSEEVGEVARAVLDNDPRAALLQELVQVAATATAWAEDVKLELERSDHGRED